MLRKMFIKKIILVTATLFAVGLLYLIPKENIYTLKATEKIEYVDNLVEKTAIYLLDSNNYLGRTKVSISNTEVVSKAKELLNILIKDGEGENKIPNGFKALIPSDTKINSLSYDNGLIKVDFSEQLLDVKKEYEEKLVEAIIYTLTSIDDVKNVIIYVNGEILSKLPKTGINLPGTLNRSYGINKESNLTTYKDVNKVTVYYLAKSDENYYIPVTKYVNDNREKIKIIIDELSSSYIYSSNLMSFLNSNTQLLATEQELDTLFLVFNEYIFSDMITKNILEEVIYTISLSVKDNYDVNEVVFTVGGEEIYKSAIKSIEKY